jgi:hypothetical protein
MIDLVFLSCRPNSWGMHVYIKAFIFIDFSIAVKTIWSIYFNESLGNNIEP